jgi:hypothetical protein
VLGLSNGARPSLTGFVAGLARATAEHNVTIHNLLPRTFGTCARLRQAISPGGIFSLMAALIPAPFERT